MNRARRMAALTARALAAAGVGVLLLDPHGTGDSGGDFADARWDTWRTDAATAAAWVEAETGAPAGLWGLRLGGLLAAQAVAAAPSRYARLVLWAPVTKGETFLTQFLRIRVAAAMGAATGDESEGGGESTKALRAAWQAGETVEVAGYEVAPALAAGMDGASLADAAPPATLPVDWFEMVAEAGRDPAPGARKAAATWVEAGSQVALRPVVGDPFWSLQEIALAPNLIAATVAALTETPGAGDAP